MNLKNTAIILSITILLLACGQERKASENSLIDKGKVRALFDKNSNNVLFNHLYVVLDSISYARFRSNTFLKESYAGMDRGLPDFETIDDTVSSIYLRGEKHYLEILGPNNRFNEPVGRCGIGFSLDGKHSHFLNNSPELKEKNTKFLQGSDTVSMTIKGKELVWYRPFYTFGMKTNMYTWFSYYNPEFLEAIHGEKYQTYSQETFLKSAYAPDKLLRNVVAITLGCNPADHFRMGRELQLLGCPMMKDGKKNPVFKVGDVYIRLILDHRREKSGILNIESTLQRPDNRILQLGGLTIKNEEKKSLWTFDLPSL
ncbi:DUF5829 family protein [Pricia sp.]|uniref:DUF5829 family protein n=1 Tax=Pricia sp. TaxID=2268138 RepID=UPI0035946DF2